VRVPFLARKHREIEHGRGVMGIQLERLLERGLRGWQILTRPQFPGPEIVPGSLRQPRLRTPGRSERGPLARRQVAQGQQLFRVLRGLRLGHRCRRDAADQRGRCFGALEAQRGQERR
jgi:hypothetical protein